LVVPESVELRRATPVLPVAVDQNFYFLSLVAGGACGDAVIRTAAFLRKIAMLAGLPDELLERLAGEVREVAVRAGGWILREGEAADSVFIVRSGRVEVVDEGPPEALIRILRRGDVLVELALLREGTRSMSARARGDVDLFELGRPQFEALIQEALSFALGLTRAMGSQLAASRTPVAGATPPQTVAVVGLDRAVAVQKVAERLANALAAHGSVARLRRGDDNLPVATMARTGEGPVIAVDVTGRMGPFARSRRPGIERMGRPLRRALTGTDAPVPRLGETIMRTLTVGSIDTVAAARLHADLVIAPDVEGIGLMEWQALDRVRELGRAAARRVLADEPDLSGWLAG
jgi:CRP-like cAMP-binding protein